MIENVSNVSMQTHAPTHTHTQFLLKPLVSVISVSPHFGLSTLGAPFPSTRRVGAPVGVDECGVKDHHLFVSNMAGKI